MKKLIVSALFFWCLLFFSVFTFNSCATFDAAALKTVDNVAMLSIYCDKRIEFRGFKSKLAFLSAIAQEKEFNLLSTVQNLKTKIMVVCAPSFPFTFVPESEIIGSTTYQTLDQNNPLADLNPLFFELPEGYKALPNSLSIIELAAQGYPGADGFMFVYVDYVLIKKFELLGFGTADIQATISMIVKDKAGKILLQKYEVARSNNTIKFALGGVFDASDIRPLCEEATDIALDHITRWIRNKLSKSK
ncbi:MAG: hypothetical protein JXJ04_23665 [Spirochaetales bacterium]|nr:hypothetical protein [Spirochaetales bacterium]